VPDGLTTDEVRRHLGTLSPEWQAAIDARTRWLSVCRANQLPPLGQWSTWLALAGRGWGKTRTGAEWLWWEAWRDPGSRNAIVAPTAADLRDVAFGGESGLTAVIPPSLIASYHKSLHEITLINGSWIKGYSAEEPERLRGPQHHRAWCDELRAWQYPQDTWDMLQFGLRLGSDPRVFVTTTSKPLALLSVLLRDKSSRVTGGSTYENRSNLPPKFFQEIVKYEGTTVGRQEIYAEIINPEEMGVYKRSWFRLWPADFALPKMQLIVQSYDTAFTEHATNDQGDPDPTALTVWGIFSPRDSLPADLVKELKADVPFAALLCDAWTEHLGFPELLERVKTEHKRRYGPKPGRGTDVVLIEDKGSGISLRQSLRKEGIVARPYNPGRASKLQRAYATSHLPHGGLVWLPGSSLPTRRGKPRDWCEPYLEQVCGFAGEGTVPHDDFVDTTTQVLEYLLRTGWLTTFKDEPETLMEQVARSRDKDLPRNPYASGPSTPRPKRGNPYVEGTVATGALLTPTVTVGVNGEDHG
jgi:phage terminase large subunit-like protein